MIRYKLLSGLALALLLVPCGRCAGQSNTAATSAGSAAAAVSDEERIRRADSVLDRLPFPVRSVSTLPGDLKGQAAYVPFGPAAKGERAYLYVPASYSPGRTWPLLVEGAYGHSGAWNLKDFYPLAESHGFLLLVVEYSYPEAPKVDSKSGWTRQGEQDFGFGTRPAQEVLNDMVSDENDQRLLVRQVSERYNLEPKAFGITGYLFAGTMAYRAAAASPDLWCCAIARTAYFNGYYMPAVKEPSRQKLIYIVYGEKEPDWSIAYLNEAKSFLKRENFTNVQIECIPNSGVDSRPEIAANYFQGAFEQILGAEQIAFYRAYMTVVRCLNEAAPDPLHTSSLDVKTVARDPNPPAPVTPEKALAALKAFEDAYPKSAFKPNCTYIKARLILEKQGDAKAADALLRPFLQPTLRKAPVAVPALFYLVEKLISHKTNADEADRILNVIIIRPGTSPADVERARALRKELHPQ